MANDPLARSDDEHDILFVLPVRPLSVILTVIVSGAALAQQAPRIDSISPSQGPITGGTIVTIRGANLDGAALTLDKVEVALQVISSSEARFTTHPHDNTFVTIRVGNPAGAAYAEFLYIPTRLDELPPGYITTVAGIGKWSGFYRRATEAELRPQGTLAFDSRGFLYVTEAGYQRVSRVRPDGTFEPFAGSGEGFVPGIGIGDGGPAEEAIVAFPRGIAIDLDGTVYIGDQEHRIRRVDPQTGMITTISGDGTRGFSGDGGPARLARLNEPTKLTGDGHGTIYFIDYGNYRIRRITPNGIISTVAGTGTPGFSGDGGPATQAQFDLGNSDFGALALDPGRSLYLADTANNRIRRIDLQTGIITTIAGPSDERGDPTDSLHNVAGDAEGNLYYTTTGRIVVMNRSGQIIASYGSRDTAGWSDGGTPIGQARLGAGDGLVVDQARNILFVQGEAVRRLNLANGRLETFAGVFPGILGESGPALATTLSFFDHGSLALLPTGELLIGDGRHERIRKVDRNGAISTIARGGSFAPPQWNGETFIGVSSLEIDSGGNIYLTDVWRALKLDADGILHPLTGSSACGFSGDGGPAIQAEVCQPFDVILDREGNYLISDTNNNRIRRIDARTGTITSIVGGGPISGWERWCQGAFCGDGTLAAQACLNGPKGIAVDAAGNLFLADQCNSRIRKVDRQGIITTLKENIAAVAIALDPSGRVYSSEAFDVTRFDQDGASTRIACRELFGFSGDGGPALQAVCSGALDIVIDPHGNLFFIDAANDRVRAVRYGAVLAPPDATIQASASGTSVRATVFDAQGRPAPGVRVEFSAPASGPSCRFPNNAHAIGLITDENGVAVTTCTAACRGPGQFLLTVRPAGATATAALTLNDASAACRQRPVRR